MAFNINTFKTTALQNDGYRGNLFEIEIARAGANMSLLARATSVPAMTVTPIEVGYFGRKIKLAGERTYADWTTTIMVDESFATRSNLEEWNAAINTVVGNVRGDIGYKEDATIKLYGKAGDVIRTYTLVGCWPSSVDPITLDWDTTGAVATFDVTWSFDYMDVGQ